VSAVEGALASSGIRHSDLRFRRRTIFPFAPSDAEENNPSTVRISSQRDRKRWVRLAITGCLTGR
jgi:hypothetical protein